MKQKHMNKMIQQTKLKNFAQTDFSRKSGPGTDMLSSNGQSTISFYKVFQQSLMDGDAAANLYKESTALKHKKLLQALAFVPEEVFNERMLQNIQQQDIDQLGQIAQEGKQQLIINKLESMIDSQLHKDILDAQPRTDSQTTKLKDEPDKDENDYLQEQIDLHANKFKVDPNQQATFNTVSRTDKNIEKKYYGEQISQGPIYRPDYSHVWKKASSHVAMIDLDKAHKPREKTSQPHKPVRKFMREASNQTMQPLNASIARGQMTESKEQLLTDRKNKLDILDQSKLSMRTIPEECRYANKRIGHKNIGFDLQKSRESNIMLENPFPGDPRFSKANAHEQRFNKLEVNLDKVSGKLRPLVMANMDTQLSRNDILIKTDSHPDSNLYQTTQYNKITKFNQQGTNLGSLKFDKRPLRYFHAPQKQFDMPDGYDHQRLQKGYNLLSSNKKIKGHIKFQNQLERDYSMYNLDRKDFKSIELELNKRRLNFNDYIPNSLKPLMTAGLDHSRPESKFSQSTSNISLSNTQGMIVPPIPTKNQSNQNFSKERFSSILNSRDGVFDYTFSQRDNSLSNKQTQGPYQNILRVQRPGFNSISNSGISHKLDKGDSSTPAKRSIADHTTTPLIAKTEASMSLANLRASEETELKSQVYQVPNNDKNLPKSLRSIQFDSFDNSQMQTAASRILMDPVTPETLAVPMQQNYRSERAFSERALTNISKAQKKNFAKQKKLVHVNGSFLQFDEGSNKLMDISKKIIRNPHSRIIGENDQQAAIVIKRHQMNV